MHAIDLAPQQLLFEKIASHDRIEEPIEFAVPFAEGTLAAPGMFRLLDPEGRAVPCQIRATSTWPDGTVRWLYGRALVDLPGDAEAIFTWDLQDAPAPQSRRKVTLAETETGIAAGTGPLQAVVTRNGFRPLTDIRLHGEPLWEGEGFNGCTLEGSGQAHSTKDAALTLTVIEEGPLCAIIEARGPHGDAESPFDLRARYVFWAGKPYVAVDYQIVLMRGEAEDWPLRKWTLSFRADPETASPRLRTAYGHYGTQITENETETAFRYDAERYKTDGIEHLQQAYAGDMWCGWEGGRGGMAVSLKGGMAHFPKGMKVTREGLDFELYPEDDPLPFPFGAAKTHGLLLQFHAAGVDVDELVKRSLQWQIPDTPIVAPAQHARSGVWPEDVFGEPYCRRFEARINDLIDNRPVGMGIFNYGDEVDWGYTNQGRGGDDVVWLNNEYDLVHAMFLQYARAGVRRALECGRNCTRHWMDMDIVHASPDPHRVGGHVAHCAGHIYSYITPSHQWVEGLLDAYHLCDDREAYEAALGIGANIVGAMKNAWFAGVGNAQTREMGWALRALVALYIETNDEKWREPAAKIADLFVRWHKEMPGFLAPYTNHAHVRVNFMNALTVVSLYRYWQAVGDAAVKQLILEEMDDIIANGVNTGGLFYYKELPSLKRNMINGLLLQALGAAYAMSGDMKYLRAGLPSLEAGLVNQTICVHAGAAIKTPHPTGAYCTVTTYPPGGKALAGSLMPSLEFLYAARETDLAKQVDYKLELR